MAAGSNVRPRQDFNLSLNGYRGLCAMLVFVYHIGSAKVVTWPSGSPVADAVGYLWSSLTYGVEMFFMISGFVILGSALRHPTTGAFLRDRVARIFSAWVPTLCTVTALCIVFQVKPLAGVDALEAGALFVANLFLLPPIVQVPMIHKVSWSLSYEWVFYLVAAGAVVLYRRRSPRHIQVLWLALGALFILLFPRALFFVTGVLVFKYRAWFAERARWLQYPVISLLVFLVAWRATHILMAHLSDTVFDFLLDGRWLALVIAFIASIHLFASVTVNASRQFAFLSGNLFQFLGRISYSFYLWHALVMSVTKRIFVPPVMDRYGVVAGVAVFALSSLAIAIPVSWVSWNLFEVRLAGAMKRAFRPQQQLAGTVSDA